MKPVQLQARSPKNLKVKNQSQKFDWQNNQSGHGGTNVPPIFKIFESTTRQAKRSYPAHQFFFIFNPKIFYDLI